jgi:dTDP-4-dehydrorhamnose reductase
MNPANALKKVFVTGASGLVGSKFIELYKDKYNFITPKYPEFDLTDKESVDLAIQKDDPDVVVNFAAFTDVGVAESQKEDKNSPCYKINVLGVENLLGIISPKTHFIQISTDMIFSGSENDPGPYEEDHFTDYKENDLTWYGYTKNLAEKNAPTILRLIYPVNPKYDLKFDYLKKPLSLYDSNKLYPMFTDQKVSIVIVDKVAEALDKIIDGNKRGIFHASSEDTSTPFELISYLIEKARGVKDVVKPAFLAEFIKTVDNPVRYPKFGGLKVEKTEKELGIKFGTWREMIDKFVSQLQ